MYLQNYRKCIFCKSSKLKITKDQTFLKNFYIDAIKSDLDLSDETFKKMKVFKCTNCYNIQNNPWFKKEVAKKIFSEIYGQHNRGWSNAINFFNRGVKPKHGDLFKYLQKKIKVKNYAEFNSPFMGLMIDFFSNEYLNKLKFYKNLFSTSLKYLSVRQVAGYNKSTKKQSHKKAKNLLMKIKKLKSLNLIKKKVNKYLITDNSYFTWGENDNFKSVNSKTLASNLFNIKILDLKEIESSLKFDLFGIFHTLDHTHQPKKILDLALKISKYVIVYCHVDRNLEKQHLFSFTYEFLNYLNKNNIYTKDLTKIINKKYKSPELYFLCSKSKIKF